jgi:hypothetical protein
MEPEPIATPRGTLRTRIVADVASRVRTRVYIWGDHPAVPSPGDALLVVESGGTRIELVLSGAEIADVADALLACVQMRAEHEDYLSAPVTRQRAA